MQFKYWGSFTFMCCLGHNRAEPEVTVTQGRLKGIQTTVKGTDRPINAFLGIPFAKAPLGSLRFSPPEPPEPWNGLRDATSYPPLWELLSWFVYRTCSLLSGYRGLMFAVVNMLPVLKCFLRAVGIGASKDPWGIPVFGNYIFSAEIVQLLSRSVELCFDRLHL